MHLLHDRFLKKSDATLDLTRKMHHDLKRGCARAAVRTFVAWLAGLVVLLIYSLIRLGATIHGVELFVFFVVIAATMASGLITLINLAFYGLHSLLAKAAADELDERQRQSTRPAS